MSSNPQPVSFQAPAPEELAPSFPGYRIENLIATGGMGAVYKAIQVSLDRPVAIKILPRETSEDPSFRDSFTAEAKAMARLNHPNLIGVYDFGEVDGILFIIMEFVAGQSLYHATNGQALQSREAARIISEVCAGLAHAHEHGIIHRDIKPSNILLDQQGRPKIGDFGLAHPIGRTATDGEMIFGTPHYTAPEVLARPKAVGARADIFSVGVMLHELLTATLPDVDLRPASAVCGCDPRFDAIIKKATHPVPEMRYRSASEIVAELAPLLRVGATSGSPTTSVLARGGTPIPPRALSTPARRRPVVYRREKSSVGIWIVLLLLVAGAAVLFKDKLSPKPPPPQTKENTEQAPPEEAPPEINKVLDSLSTKQANPRPKTDEMSEPKTFQPSSTNPDEENTHTAKKSGPPKTKPKTTPLKPSTFDLAAFLERGRKVMRDKAKPAVEAHDKELSASLDLFLRNVKRAIHRLDSNLRYPAETRAESVVDGFRANHNRMPLKVDAGKLTGGQGWNISGDIDQAHQEALDRQTAADDKFSAELDALCAIYINGLEINVAKLQQLGDEQGVNDLENEAKLSRGNLRRFKNIILGRELNDVDPDVEKVDNGKGKRTGAPAVPQT
jgi:serine/threonine-protein kinase